MEILYTNPYKPPIILSHLICSYIILCYSGLTAQALAGKLWLARPRRFGWTGWGALAGQAQSLSWQGPQIKSKRRTATKHNPQSRYWRLARLHAHVQGSGVGAGVGAAGVGAAMGAGVGAGIGTGVVTCKLQSGPPRMVLQVEQGELRKIALVSCRWQPPLLQ